MIRRIGVLGDTHGDLKRACRAFKSIAEVDLILHTGDYYRDGCQLGQILGKEVVGVSGNCDFLGGGPKEQILEIEGKRIYLTHGHQYGAKGGNLNLFYRGKEVEADLVVFGHTHITSQETIEDIIIFNPGSLTKPRNSKPTFGLITIEGDKLEVRTLYI